MGKKVNQTQLAEILGVSDVTLWEWQKQGLPIAGRGDRGQENSYDTAAVIAWMIEREVRKVSTETQRDRLARLQADVLEIELAEKKNTLVPAAEIEPAWQTRVLSAAAFAHAAPSRWAQELEARPGIEAKRAFLKDELAAFLTHLGVEGERMQAEVEGLLARLSEQEAAAFITRLTAHGATPDTRRDTDAGMGEDRPAGENPAQ